MSPRTWSNEITNPVKQTQTRAAILCFLCGALCNANPLCLLPGKLISPFPFSFPPSPIPPIISSPKASSPFSIVGVAFWTTLHIFNVNPFVALCNCSHNLSSLYRYWIGYCMSGGTKGCGFQFARPDWTARSSSSESIGPFRSSSSSSGALASIAASVFVIRLEVYL